CARGNVHHSPRDHGPCQLSPLSTPFACATASSTAEMLLRRGNPTAVERSRVNLPECERASVHKDKPSNRVANGRKSGRGASVTDGGCLPRATTLFEVEMKAAGTVRPAPAPHAVLRNCQASA